MIKLPKNEKYIKAVAETLAKEMKEDPLNVALLRDPQKRESQLTVIFLPEVRYCFEEGLVYATSYKLEGIAMWLTPGSKLKNLSMLFKFGGIRVISHISPIAIIKFMQYDKFAQRLRDRFAPTDHWYLHNIAVKQSYRGKGFAGKLLKPILKDIDTSGRICFLETQNPQNVPIYKHYGFQVVWEGKIPHIEEVKHWAMLRKPHG